MLLGRQAVRRSSSSSWALQKGYMAMYSTVVRPPAPAPAAASQPVRATNSAPITPRQRYQRDQSTPRELPNVQSTTPILLSVAVVATLSWGMFLFYATNTERANSSVVRSLAFQLRSSPVVQEFLGPHVKLPTWFGEFKRVKGNINMLAGRIDVQFRVTGADAGGTAAFTSVRRGKEGRFEVLRWKITRDDGAVLDLQVRDPRDLHQVSDVPSPAPTTPTTAAAAAAAAAGGSSSSSSHVI